jgi:hypothetical protein
MILVRRKKRPETGLFNAYNHILKPGKIGLYGGLQIGFGMSDGQK